MAVAVGAVFKPAAKAAVAAQAAAA